MSGDATVALFENLISIVWMGERLDVGIKIRVQTVFRGKANERLQILVVLRLGFVDIVEKDQNRSHAGMGHRIEVRLRKDIVAVAGVCHAHGEARRTHVSAVLQKRSAFEVHHIFKMIERLRQSPFVETDEPDAVGIHLDGIGALLQRECPLRKIAKSLRGENVLSSAQALERDADAHAHRFGEIVGKIAGYPAHERS